MKPEKSAKKVLTFQNRCDIMGKVKQVVFYDLYKKKKESEESFEVALAVSKSSFKTLLINNLETIKILKTEQ